MTKSDEILKKMNEWQKELDALGKNMAVIATWETADGEFDWDKCYRVLTEMKSRMTDGAPQHTRRTPPRAPFKRCED